MLLKRICVAAALASVFAGPVLAESLTIDQVVALNAAGVGDEAVIAKIKSSDAKFDLTADQMIALKSQGVSGAVIAAMLAGGGDKPVALSLDSPDPMVPHAPGVYLLADWEAQPKMSRIDATVSNQAKTGGILGYAFTGGIASLSIKAAIQNETARTKSKTKQPTFYMFFDEANPNGPGSSSAWASGTATTVTSPNEFTLIRLTKKDGRREARVGSANIAGAKTGVMDKDRISFDYTMIRPGVYKASPNAALAPGEYGFIYAINGGGSNGALTARIFDFSVE